MDEAIHIAGVQKRAAKGQGGYVEAADVFKRLVAAGNPKPKTPKAKTGTLYRRSAGERGIMVKKRGKQFQMEFDATLSDASLRGAFENFLKSRKS